MCVGRDHQLVRAGPLGEPVEPRAHLVGRAVHDVGEPAVDELPLRGAVFVGGGLLGGRHQARPAGAQPQHGQRARAHLAQRLLLVLGGERLHADLRVRPVEDRRGAEGLAVEVEGGDGVGGREVVGEGERQPERPGELGAESGGAQQPDHGPVRGLHAAGDAALDGAGDRVDAGVAVAAGEVVVQEPGQLRELLREFVRPLVQPVGAAQRGGGRAVRAGGAAEAEVDPARREGFEGAELLGDDQGRVVGEHHAAGAEADAVRVRREVGQDDGRGGRRDTGHGVVLGHPEPLEPAPLGQPCQLDRGAQRLAGGQPAADRRQVQYGQGYGRAAPRLGPDGVGCLLDAVLVPHFGHGGPPLRSIGRRRILAGPPLGHR